MTKPPVDQALIGCWMIDADVAEEACQGISASYLEGVYGYVYPILMEMRSENIRINIQSLWGRWEKEHKTPLPKEIQDAELTPPSAHECSNYVKDVVERHKRKVAAVAVHNIQEALKRGEKSMDEIMAMVEAMLMQTDVNEPKTYDPKATWLAFVNELERREALKGKLGGIATGFTDLDGMLDGLQSKALTIIGARPTQGKTALACGLALRAAIMDQIPTLFISLEMIEAEIVRRMSSAFTNVPIERIKKATLSNYDAEKLVEFGKLYCKSPFYFTDGVGGMDNMQVASCVRRNVRKHGIKLVILDYLQKCRAAKSHDMRTYEVSQVSGTCKAVAKELNVAFVALAQLSRDNDKEGRMPRISDLADSAQIERDADSIILLHRARIEGTNDEEVKLHLAKQRDGETGNVKVRFDGSCARFQPLYTGREDE